MWSFLGFLALGIVFLSQNLAVNPMDLVPLLADKAGIFEIDVEPQEAKAEGERPASKTKPTLLHIVSVTAEDALFSDYIGRMGESVFTWQAAGRELQTGRFRHWEAKCDIPPFAERMIEFLPCRFGSVSVHLIFFAMTKRARSSEPSKAPVSKKVKLTEQPPPASDDDAAEVSSSSEPDDQQPRSEEAQAAEFGEAVPGTDPQEAGTFRDLGVCEELALACERLGWVHPTPIQRAALPVALAGRDLIGIAETGSGKTAAFAIPMLQDLLEVKQKMFGLVLAPTRELSHQIADHFKALGSAISLVVAVIIGGVDMVTQTLALAEKPHVIIASPGRLLDHLENTKGFSLKGFKYLVMDEADRLLSMDFEAPLARILDVLPRKRKTYLYSATMTSQVNKLKRASLTNPVKVSVNSKHATASNLVQSVVILPFKHKMTFMAAIADLFSAYRCIVFANTCAKAKQLTVFLRHLGFPATSLHGQMPQAHRLGALNQFKAGKSKILCCTEVGSRGLDIDGVDVVINFDVPSGSKDYIHRVGRTARAGKSGKALTLVTQYDVFSFQKIEQSLDKKLSVFDDLPEEDWRAFEAVAKEAERTADEEVKETESEIKRRKAERFNNKDGGGGGKSKNHRKGNSRRRS